MDFTTALAAPVAVRVNGALYSLPRFLLPAMRDWAAAQQKRQVDAATAHLDKDEKARFLLYFAAKPVDILNVFRYAVSPEGCPEIIARQMALAGVPEADIRIVCENGDPVDLRNLAEELVSCRAAQAEISQGTGGGESDPLAMPPGLSGGSPSTGEASLPSTPTPTAA